MRPARWRSALRKGLLLGLVLAAAGGAAVAAMERSFTAGPRPDGTGITPQGWTVSPAGRQIELGDRPYGMALSPDGRTLLVSNNGQSTQSLMVVETETGAVRQTLPYVRPEALYLGVVFSPDGTRAYASAGGNNKIRVYDVAGQQLTETRPIPLPAQTVGGAARPPYPAGLAISRDGRTLYVANNLADSLSVVEIATGAVTAVVPVGRNPYTVVLSADGQSAYVSNWGEQTVSVVDTAARTVRDTVAVGTHPSALALSPRRAELYVANGDSDTVSVIDTTTSRVVRTIDLAPYAGAPEGSSPNALAVAPDGDTLYVANAGNNDIAVVRLAAARGREDDGQRRDDNRDGGDARRGQQAGGAGQDRIEGMIPTAWYPAAVAIAPDGSRLYVANAKGLGAGPNPNGPNPYRSQTPPDQYVGSMMKGTLSIVDVPDRERLARYTRQVIANNGFDERVKRVEGSQRRSVIPRRPGDPSPIKHVIYVVKENRTYDQVFGDLPGGNGDPSLLLFGDESAPNQRALARRFVLLDNFYADAEVSADGWNWSTAAVANTYVQKNWPAAYSGRSRSYDFEGGNFATAPGRDPTNAYLWDRLTRAGVSYRNYGVWASGSVPAVVAATEPELAKNTDPAYPGYNLRIRDQVRADEWLREFRAYEARGDLPTFQFVRLPNDHTSGTRPGAPTPRAMMADNDLALGRIVEAVSTSRFWKETAIFVVEDDAQNGPDHVDAHRTVALVVSPYTQTGTVDSTFYSTVSMLRTMELIVGIPPLTQFDAAATPMLNSFTDRPDTRAYTAIVPPQSLEEVNGSNAPLAAASAAMDLTQEDRAPEQLLNVAIWKSIKGAASEMPAPRTSFRDLEQGDAD